MIKKLLSSILIAVLIICTTVYASAIAYIIIGDYKVFKNTDNTLTLAGYEGTGTEFIVADNLYDIQITEIDKFAFSDNTTLTKLVLPDSITKIGESAFLNNTTITEITLGKNITEIGLNAFYGCSNIKSITLGDHITEIKPYVFNRCSSITEFNVPNSVKSIGDYSFFKCTNLTKITIPSSVTEIYSTAFLDCPNLTIYGESGSYAQTFANANSIKFVSTNGGEDTTAPTQNTLIGDANNDGVLDKNDINLIQSYCIKLVGSDLIQTKLADVDLDNHITIKDVTCIQKKL